MHFKIHLLTILICTFLCRASCAQTGTVEIDLLEQETETPLTCRVKITDAQGKTMRARRALSQSGWSLIESPMIFRGRPGKYRYQVSHGPQFATGRGEFELDKKSEGYDVLRLPRHADLAKERWFGGDLASSVSPEQTLRWLPAEDLVTAVYERAQPQGVSTESRSDKESRWVESRTFVDQRAGSGLAFHHWLPPAEVPRELPSSRLLIMAKNADTPSTNTDISDTHNSPPVHIEVTRLWARDFPIWLASKRLDSIRLMASHLTYDGKRPAPVKVLVDPDPGRFAGELGPGRLVEYLYWQTLEAGFQIPPSAGSGFGRTTSPLGYNRVYVHSGRFEPDKVDPRTWWESLQSGRVFVTNGPLLRATVNGEVPGATFEASAGESIDLDVALKLTVSDPVDYVDIIFNGHALYHARLDEYAKQGGQIPLLTVDQSGWLLVRVVTARDHTYRFATTAPYYVRIGGQSRISKQSVEFFQRWLDEAEKAISESVQASASKPYIEAAKRFWSQRLEQSNAP